MTVSNDSPDINTVHGVLGCDAAWTLYPFQRLNMKAVSSSETLVPIYKATRFSTQKNTTEIFTALRTSNIV
jgi:hypothetical protein